MERRVSLQKQQFHVILPAISVLRLILFTSVHFTNFFFDCLAQFVPVIIL